MRRLPLLCLLAVGLSLFPGSPCMADTFPYREIYPEIRVIELQDLQKGLAAGEFIAVDVRSPAEFNAIHMEGAVNLPYTNAKFAQNLGKIARENQGRKIAVYCNGITCIKCYKAAEDALYAGIPDVYAFDAGIKIWAQTYPGRTILNGSRMVNAQTLLAAESKFSGACLDYDSFLNRAAADDAVVIDARDPMQRKHPLPGIQKPLQIPLDKLVNNIISKGHMKDKQLFIFDQVGKQVNWLMFYLEENGYTNYHFLDGGATAVLKVQEYR